MQPVHNYHAARLAEVEISDLRRAVGSNPQGLLASVASVALRRLEEAAATRSKRSAAAAVSSALAMLDPDSDLHACWRGSEEMQLAREVRALAERLDAELGEA